jgi:signal-transduction protein with cAMP-binding, CBS, and nucleotidyltransferase domain
MRRFYDKTLVETYLRQTKHESIMRGLQEHLFVAQYEKGEFITMPLQQEHLFQIIIQGSVSIYLIRDNGAEYSLANSKENDLLGEMEIFSHQLNNVYAESNGKVICLALSVETSKSALLENCRFLQLICESLTQKMESITAIDAAPANLKQHVLTYMKYKCGGGELRGLQQAAFQLNCSTRQLQRILNQYEVDGIVIKTGKGTYRLTNSTFFLQDSRNQCL